VTTQTRPTLSTGKICYIEIPATDVDRSATFYQRAFGWTIRQRGDGATAFDDTVNEVSYQRAFGWTIRQRGDGATAFDDTVNEVSGAWVLGRPAASEPGLMVYIMVADAAAAVDSVVAAGGEIVQPVDPNSPEVVATFRDPGGNVLGIYQQPGLAESVSATGGSARG